MSIADELPAWALPMYAAAWQHYDELRSEPVLSRADLVTVDEQLARDSARTALEIIHAYAVQWPVADANLSGTEPVIRQHVVRSHCLTTLHSRWSAAWRDTPAQERAFNSACRALGWFRGRELVTVTVTADQARAVGIDPRGRDRTNVPGVALTPARLAELEAYLLDEGDSARTFGPARTLPVQQELRLTAAAGMPVEVHNAREAPTYDREPTRTLTRIQVEAVRAGPEAIAAVRAILAEPGTCAIDFETWPTNPDWHGEQAAAAAPRGGKAAARDRAKHAAELNGRAHVRRPCVLALYHESGAEALVRLASGDDPAPRRAELAAMFEGRVATLVAHNAQFEVEVLLAHGVAVDAEDTLLAAKALYLTAVADDRPQPIEFGLAALVEREFGRQRDKAVRDRDWRDEGALDAEGAEYCRQDARDALELWQLYHPRLEEQHLLEGYEMIRQAALPTAAINLAGMEFDGAAHGPLVEALRAEATALEEELSQICGGAVANPASTAQIGRWVMGEVYPGGDYTDFCARLQARCGCTWKRTKGGALAITKQIKPKKAEALAGQYPAVSRYLIAHATWTHATKLLGTFGPSLAGWVDGDGRLRGQLKMGGTVTLRHSASRPNVQQMPRESTFRGLFRAPPGRALVVCDFSQIELRLAGIIAEDEALLEVYRTGRDVHQDVADAIGLPRSSQSKGVSYSMIYGASAGGVAEASGLPIERAAEVVELFLGAYPGLRAYRERAPVEAQELGFIPIRPGRRVLYDLALSKGTQAINFQVQGAAASVQMRALRRVYDALEARPELEARLVGAIHDELLLEAPKGAQAEAAAELLQREMRAALIEVFPEATAMGADRLAAATVCSSWAEKA